MLNVLLVVILFPMTVLPAWANTLDIMTEEDPPYSFLQADAESTVKAWQDGFQSMKDDGTLRKILQTWLPNAIMPEYEEPTD